MLLHVSKRILLASEIATLSDVLQAIEWVAKGWKEVTAGTIKNCFAKCNFTEEVETCSSVPAINSDAVDWRVSSLKKCVAEYLRKESGKDDIEVVSSDGDDNNVDLGNTDVEAEVHEITTCEALILLDKLVNMKELNKDERASLSSIKNRLEIIRVKSKKQRPIKNFFK